MQADHVFEKNHAMEGVVRIYETAVLVSVSQNTPRGVTNSQYKIPVSTTAYRFTALRRFCEKYFALKMHRIL